MQSLSSSCQDLYLRGRHLSFSCLRCAGSFVDGFLFLGGAFLAFVEGKSEPPDPPDGSETCTLSSLGRKSRLASRIPAANPMVMARQITNQRVNRASIPELAARGRPARGIQCVHAACMAPSIPKAVCAAWKSFWRHLLTDRRNTSFNNTRDCWSPSAADALDHIQKSFATSLASGGFHRDRNDCAHLA